MTGSSNEHARLLAELDWVRGLARMLVGRDADDLVQDVAVAALQAPEPPTGLRSWLSTVARRGAVSIHRRKVRQRRAHVGRPERDGPESPVLRVERLEQQREVAGAVLALPEPYRATIIARFIEGDAIETIAAQASVREATVRQRLHRGKKMLRAHLQSTWGSNAPAALLGLGWPHGVTSSPPLASPLTSLSEPIASTAAGASTAGAMAAGTTVLGTSIMVKNTVLAGVAVVGALLLGWAVLPSPNDQTQSPSKARRPNSVAGVAVIAGDRVAALPEALDESMVRAPGTAQRESSLTILVMNDASDPLADAAVHLLAAGSVTSHSTNGEGRVTFPKTAAAAQLLVVPQDRPPHFEVLDARAGEHEVVLPIGAKLTGRIERLDGGDSSNVSLSLNNLDQVSFLAAPLPSALARILEQADQSIQFLRARTDAAGLFVFAGLPADWSGTLTVDPRYRVIAERSMPPTASIFVDIERPRTDILLVIEPMPGISGRVHWETGEPVVRARVQGFAVFAGSTGEDDSEYVLIGLPTDIEGNFANSFRAIRGGKQLSSGPETVGPNIKSLQFSVRHPDAVEPLEFDLAGTQFPHGGYFGNLVLRRSSQLHLLVLDQDGDPLQGAQVEGASIVTGVDGRTVAGSGDPAAKNSYRIRAPGCLTTLYPSYDGTGSAKDPFRYQLQTGTQLEVVVRPSEWNFADLMLRVTSKSELFTAPDFFDPNREPMRRASPRSTKKPDKPRHPTWIFSLGSEGRVLINSIKPNQRLQLDLVDELGHVVGSKRVSIRARTTKTVKIDARTGVVHVAGEVRLGGVIQSGATVNLRTKRGQTTWITDSEGRISKRVARQGGKASLSVRTSTSAIWRRDVDLNSRTGTLHIDLVHGYPLDLFVIDAAGQPADATVIHAERPAVVGERIQKGRFRFMGLTAGSHRFRIERGTGSTVITLDPTRTPEQRVRAPN